jgi:hypothetical protein
MQTAPNRRGQNSPRVPGSERFVFSAGAFINQVDAKSRNSHWFEVLAFVFPAATLRSVCKKLGVNKATAADELRAHPIIYSVQCISSGTGIGKAIGNRNGL